ncbi:MAG: MBL fold metallo-hydrolase [Anaerolineales bacterium]|nr:MBL fold metallo-hydrolase [Anaerolineales bacterium]MCK5635400.1 MBL fold metallo-hydrolase [Anaerolineales bacterium]
MMRNPINIGSVDQVSITFLVDNKADLVVESSDRVRYFTDEPLLAEHGFSVLIQLGDVERNILWDAGVSKITLIENMRRMKFDSASIAKIALSHGHHDHYAAMTDLLIEMDLLPEDKEWGTTVKAKDVEEWLESFRIPIVAHPAALRERWWEKDDGTMVGPFLPPPALEWKAAGAKIVLSEGPSKLEPGCWTTGFIPRKSFEESGRSKKLRYRSGSDFFPDDLEDDQAIVINVEGKGLIVLSGCAHSGIVNTVNHAKDFFKIDSIYAVMGGFHLSRASDDEIDRTVDFIHSLGTRLVVPSHCTGIRAISRFAQKMPDEFVEGVVGATYLL